MIPKHIKKRLPKELVNPSPLSQVLAMAVFVALPIVGFLLGMRFEEFRQEQLSKSITSFEECQRAGFSVQESLPARCVVPDGRVFVQFSGIEDQAAID